MAEVEAAVAAEEEEEMAEGELEGVLEVAVKQARPSTFRHRRLHPRNR